MDEFTMGPIQTAEELDRARGFLLRIFPARRDDWRGPRFFHDRLADQSPMMLAAKRGAEIVGVALGHVEGDGRGVIDHLAVAPAVRRQGLGRELLLALESGARGLGVRRLALGSVDSAVGFYERCGYKGTLLLQFEPPARRDEVAPLFADFPALETQWGDVPQLWVQTTRIDLTLTDRVRGRAGVNAQWVMGKDLNPRSTQSLGITGGSGGGGPRLTRREIAPGPSPGPGRPGRTPRRGPPRAARFAERTGHCSRTPPSASRLNGGRRASMTCSPPGSSTPTAWPRNRSGTGARTT